jgi:hypothetical protein
LLRGVSSGQDAQGRQDNHDDQEHKGHGSGRGVVPQDEGQGTGRDDDDRGQGPVHTQPLSDGTWLQSRPGEGLPGSPGASGGGCAHGDGTAAVSVQIPCDHGEQGGEEHGENGLPEEPHQGVVEGCCCVLRLGCRRHRVQTDLADHGECDEQHAHHGADTDACGHQRNPV